MSLATFEKDPQAVLDYRIDWSDWLADGDTLVSSSWAVPAGINLDSATFTTTAATIWLSGGTAGAVYALTNHVTTAQGRADDRTIKIKAKAR